MVTAPTCGACGIVPGLLYFLQHHMDAIDDEDIIDALAVAGVIGNIAKVNASISGAEAGCQAEVGVACAMAAGAATFLMGGSTEQIEYAAGMAIEHMLGLTCDPVKGLVQVPCIERNAMAAGRALECAEYALMTNTFHLISYDEVVLTMILTGEDIEDSLQPRRHGEKTALERPEEPADRHPATLQHQRPVGTAYGTGRLFGGTTGGACFGGAACGRESETGLGRNAHRYEDGGREDDHAE